MCLRLSAGTWSGCNMHDDYGKLTIKDIVVGDMVEWRPTKSSDFVERYIIIAKTWVDGKQRLLCVGTSLANDCSGIIDHWNVRYISVIARFADVVDV